MSLVVRKKKDMDEMKARLDLIEALLNDMETRLEALQIIACGDFDQRWLLVGRHGVTVQR
jgi:hypothetical protein